MRKMRHYQRYSVSGGGTIYLGGPRTGFSLKDVSASGMCILSEAELEENAIFQMDVHISGIYMNFEKTFRGKVVRRSKQEKLFVYGVRFVDLSHKDAIDIDEYLRLNHGSASLHFTPPDAESDENHIKQLIPANDR